MTSTMRSRKRRFYGALYYAIHMHYHINPDTFASGKTGASTKFRECAQMCILQAIGNSTALTDRFQKSKWSIEVGRVIILVRTMAFSPKLLALV
eukprot:4084038-Amphidinium_carterae.1